MPKQNSPINSHSRHAFHLALAAVILVSAAFPAHAQRGKRVDTGASYKAPSTLSGKTILIPIGTTFEGRLDKTLSSAKSKGGQQFNVTLSSPILANGTDVVIPAGSAVVGEVVEALKSSSLPRRRGQPKPIGKLRLQLTALRLPDGTVHPMVAKIIGEQQDKRGGKQDMPHGTGVAYAGTAAGFEAVHPSARGPRGGRSDRGPQMATRKDILSDEVLGAGIARTKTDFGLPRALVRRGNDVFIDGGSALTVQLSAPFRIAVTPEPAGSLTAQDMVDEYLQDEPLPGPTKRKGSSPDSAAGIGSPGQNSPGIDPAAIPLPSAGPQNSPPPSYSDF